MVFDFNTLVTDRKQSDVAYVKQLISKIVAGTATEAEFVEWNSFTLKGSYNYTDLNRVTAAIEYLKGRLEGYGYVTPGYQRIEVPHRTVAVSKLPEGFTELAYIESSGTQYIDTEFNPNQDSKVIVDAQFPKTPTAFAALFGARNVNTNQFWSYYRYSVDAYSGRFGTTVDKTIAFDPTKRATVTLDSNVFTVNGTSVSANSATFESEYELYLFGVNNAGTIQYPGSFKLYSCQIYDNGTLVRDFVPCKNPDGAYGLYDVVNSKFYGNAGSGAFTSGAVVDPPVTSVPSDDETRDAFLWYEDDVPTATQMAQYILNVSVIRGTLEVLSTTPAVPSDMEGMTVEEANAIEFILIDVETLINNMVAAWFYSGDLYSGEV